MIATIQTPPDGGTLYTETNLNHFFPEPLNTITSCFFLGIAVYFTIKLWHTFRNHRFLTVALILLYVGGIGGTTYHALRKWPVFIMMDWIPIMLLCLFAGIYFLTKLTRWYYALIVVVVYAFFQFFLRKEFRGEDIQVFININYAFMAAIVLLPVVGYLLKTDWLNGKWVGFAFIAFLFALTFRIADKYELLSVGTHFLWHSFGAVASFCMLYYIYLINAKSVQAATSKR